MTQGRSQTRLLRGTKRPQGLITSDFSGTSRRQQKAFVSWETKGHPLAVESWMTSKPLVIRMLKDG
jgi:hypothetical protein